jgi:GTP 3',8-cyclase
MRKIQVFLSSAMSGELKTERAVLKERFSIGRLLSSTFDLYLFEDNAAPNPAEAVYVQEVERSAIVIFLFSETLRKGVVEEFDAATRGSAIFCYLRSGAERTNELDRFISDRVRNQVQYAEFVSPEDLTRRVEADLQRWLIRLVDDTRPPASEPGPAVAQVAAFGSSTVRRFCEVALADCESIAERQSQTVAVDLSAHSLWGTVRPRRLPGLPFDRQPEVKKFDPEIDLLDLNGAVFPALGSSVTRGLKFKVRVLLLHPDSNQAKAVHRSQRNSFDAAEKTRFARTDIYLTLYVLARLARQHPRLGLGVVRVMSADDSMAFSLTRIGGHALVTPYPSDLLLEAAASYSVKGVPGDLAPFGKRLAAFEDLWTRIDMPGGGHEIDLRMLPGEFPDIVRRVDAFLERERSFAVSPGVASSAAESLPAAGSDPTPFGTRTNLLTLYREQVQAFWDGKDPYPVALEVNPANSCDQGCHWCISENVHTPGSFIDFEHPRFAAFMEEFRRFGGKAVGWSGGGEPTNHKKLAHGLSLVKAAGLSQGLITHGAFSSELLAPVVQSCDWIRISLDTNSPNDYARKRGRTQAAGLRGFGRVVDNVKALVAAGAYVGLNMNVARWNLAQVEECYEWSAALGVNYLQIRPTLLTPFPHASDEDLLSDVDRRTLLRRLKVLERRAKGSKTRLVVSYDKFEDLARPNYGRGYSGCAAHRLFVVLNAGGDLAVCMYQMTDRRFIFGNIYQDSLEGIWKSERRKEAVRFCGRDLNHELHECQVCCKGHEINKVLEGEFGGVRAGLGTRLPFI